MAKRIKERLGISELHSALRDMGYHDMEDLPASYLGAKAVLCYEHSMKDAALMLGVTYQSVQYAVKRIFKTLEEMPGRHRICPCCGKPWEARKDEVRTT